MLFKTSFILIHVSTFLRCIVKITGDMTLSFPMGIIKVFTTNPSPAVLTFKLKNTSRLEQILPNQQLLYR